MSCTLFCDAQQAAHLVDAQHLCSVCGLFVVHLLMLWKLWPRFAHVSSSSKRIAVHHCDTINNATSILQPPHNNVSRIKKSFINLKHKSHYIEQTVNLLFCFFIIKRVNEKRKKICHHTKRPTPSVLPVSQLHQASG